MQQSSGFTIGPYRLSNQLALAPMAGITDLPFRRICREMGAAMVVSEMVASKPDLRGSAKSRYRSVHTDSPEPVIVQIVGNDPQQMAEAAVFNVKSGAQIIDINMGCPAKKVCRKAAGSALLSDPLLVEKILSSVVGAVNVPVTLKTRTGISRTNKNILDIAAIAEAQGIAALTIHGRTREDKFSGLAEYEMIAAVRQRIRIPLIANGDITSPKKAKQVLEETGADAIMIGRGAQGNPWIFREILSFLETGEASAPPSENEIGMMLVRHLRELHNFYPESIAARISRKHIVWYLDKLGVSREISRNINRIDSAVEQLTAVRRLFPNLQDAAA